MNFKYFLAMSVIAGAMISCDDESSSTGPAPIPASSSDSLILQGSSSSDAGILAGSSSSDVVLNASSSSDAGVLAGSSSSATVVNPASSAGTQTSSGVPTLTEIDPTKAYTFYGCELTGTDHFTYGRFEARMKMAAISGTVSSMFLNYDDSWRKGDEPWNEIDIEVLGKDPSKWQSNIITRYPDEEGGKENKNITSESIHEYGFDATSEFHLYTIVWTPEYVAWEIDSVEVRRDTIGMEKAQVEFLTKEESLRFNLWASKTPSWTGKFTGIGLPIEQQIDYVRVYSYDAATKGFTLLWQDDFEGDDIDPNHWSAGTWEMENVEYRPENIKVSDGLVRIIMDYEAH